MIKIQVNGEDPVLVKKITDQEVILDKSSSPVDIKKVGENEYHMIHNGRSFSFVVTEKSDKEFDFSLPDKKLSIRVIEEIDELLEKMGMGGSSADVIKEIKAPMPGVILEVKTNGNSEIKKGDPIIVLEAMKMENVIKSPIDGVIEEVMVKKGDKVEKNAILVAFQDQAK